MQNKNYAHYRRYAITMEKDNSQVYIIYVTV